MVCVRLVGRRGRAGLRPRGPGVGRKLRDPWLRVDSARPLLDPWMLMLRALGRRQIRKLFTTVAATWYCVVSQIVQRPEGARCSELHTFAIARAAQPVILPGRSRQRPEGAHCRQQSERRPKGATATCCTRLCWAPVRGTSACLRSRAPPAARACAASSACDACSRSSCASHGPRAIGLSTCAV